MTIRGYAVWLLAYLSVLDEPVHLVGHSMGALVVLEATAARPDRVRSVTLVGVADRMPVNPDLLTASAANDPTMSATMGSWMHARQPVGRPEWQVRDTVAVIERKEMIALGNTASVVSRTAVTTSLDRAFMGLAPLGGIRHLPLFGEDCVQVSRRFSENGR